MPETTRPTTAPTADHVFDTAESTVENMADKARDVRDEASRVVSKASERVAEAGRQAADKVNATSAYFRDHDVNEIANDVKAYTTSHPAQALIGAAALGFVAAMLIRRS